MQGAENDILFFALVAVAMLSAFLLLYRHMKVGVYPGRHIGPTYWGRYSHSEKRDADWLRVIVREARGYHKAMGKKYSTQFVQKN